MKYTRVYRSADLGGDHYLQSSLIKVKRPLRQINTSQDALKASNITLKNRYQALQQGEELEEDMRR